MLVIGSAAVSFAQTTAPPPKLALPVKCVPGVDCWVFNYVDMDTRKDKWRDFACGHLSYDRHRGVDFAVRDLAAMKQGVPVVAAAPGRVRAIRDGMDDVGFTKENRAEISKLGCGNAVVLEHDNDWETSYCHMRKGSVLVKRGQSVVRGEQLGLVGMSGLAEFPHLHLGVRYKGKIVDPFVGVERRQRCRPGPAPLWDDETLARLPYQGAMLYNAGFASRRPFVSSVRAGTARQETLPANALKIFLFVDIRHTRRGDVMAFKIIGPGDKTLGTFERTIKQSLALNLQVVDVSSEGTWPPGTYRGEIVLTRNSKRGVKRFKTTTAVEMR